MASLLPAATEIACALGVGADLVGVSHACDYPPEVRSLPVLTRARVAVAGGDRAIHRAVGDLARQGAELYEVEVDALRQARPDVVLVQDLCELCAVSPASAQAALGRAGVEASIIVLRADSLAGVARDAVAVGEAVGRPDQGRALARDFAARLQALGRWTAELPRRRVVALEWLDPPFAAGHWVPEMVRLAGGEEALGREGEPARRVAWTDVEETRPEALCVLPCGFDLAASRRSWEAARATLEGSALEGIPVLLLDASAFFSRPGPRLARGAEVLAALLHPEAGLPPAREGEGIAA